MSDRTARLARKAANETKRELSPDIEAALENEKVTRKRVESLESWAHAFSNMGFWRRLRWVLLGY